MADSRTQADRRLASGTGLDLTALGVMWLIMVCLIDPIGNFPLDDDWSYGRAVQALVEQHHFQLTGFTAMPLVAQVFWGALFCLPAGFSFTALRLSTLVLGLAGVLATYGLLREAGAGRALALIGGCSIAFNPLYCVLSFTFMTDVPFLAFSVLALLFLVRGMLRHRTAELAVGFLFAGIALLIRQPAILIPAAFGIAYLFIRGLNRHTLLRAALPTVFAIGVLRGYRRVLAATSGVPSLYGRPYDPITESARDLSQALWLILDRLFVAAIYVGLFLLPFAIAVSAARWHLASSTPRPPRLLATFGVVAVIVMLLVWSDRLMPLSGNVLFPGGLGPPTLRDVYLLRLPHLPSAPRGIWILVTAAGVMGAVLMVKELGRTGLDLAKRRLMQEPLEGAFPALLALAACALYSGMLAIFGYLDRYLVFLLPLVLVVAISRPETFARSQPPGLALGMAGAMLGAYALFSVAATHDYLSWNRARWVALRHLTEEEKVPFPEIDGGFEFNGFYAYDPAKQFWWVEDRKYVLAFGSLPGYEVAERYPYRTWLPLGTRDILVLRRLDGMSLESHEAHPGDRGRASGDQADVLRLRHSELDAPQPDYGVTVTVSLVRPALGEGDAVQV